MAQSIRRHSNYPPRIIRFGVPGRVSTSDSTYFLFMIYVNTVVGLLFVLAVVAKDWLPATIMAMVFFLCVIPPAMMLHAKNTTKYNLRTGKL